MEELLVNRRVQWKIAEDGYGAVPEYGQPL